MRFIGSNDHDTLIGVIEELDRELRSERIKAGGAKLQRDRYAATYAVAKLSFLREIFESASKNGPTPTAEQIGAITLRLRPDARERLLASIGTSPVAGLVDADAIANDLLATVDLDRPLMTPEQQYVEDHDGGHHRDQPLSACPKCGTGMNAVDPEVSCTFCGADLDETGDCTAAIDDLCTVGSLAMEETETAMQGLAELAGIKAEVREGTDVWFILFDGMQIGSQRSRFQGQIKAIERLSVRLQGKLAGTPDITYGVCVPCSDQGGDGVIVRGIVRFNGQTWECEKHRPDWNVLGCKECGLYPDIDCPTHKPAEVGG